MKPKYVRREQTHIDGAHLEEKKYSIPGREFQNEQNPGYSEAFSALPVNLLKEKRKMTMAKHLQ